MLITEIAAIEQKQDDSQVIDAINTAYHLAQKEINISIDPSEAVLTLPFDTFINKSSLIQTARKGISGALVKVAVDSFGHRELFAQILQISTKNLSRQYDRLLDSAKSEGILDMLKLQTYANQVFGSREIADEWLNLPIPALGNVPPISLCDTFAGRDMVEATIRKIEYGEFV